MLQKKGFIIALEGIDGSGKKTQTSLIKEFFVKQQIEYLFFELPTDSAEGELIKRFLRGELEIKSVEELSLLYAADRYNISKKIKNAVEEGKVVLLDRYYPSNMAYQGARLPPGEMRDSFLIWIENVEERLPKPDMVIFLDLPPKMAKGLLLQRGKMDRNESWLSFQSEVYKIYLSICKDKKWERVKCFEGDAILPPKVIFSTIEKIIREGFPSLFNEF